jgi:tRNA G18 (ribose-2'-O)-methylase SpoU
MQTFEHQRHKPPTPLARPRELILVCAPLRSSVNLSRIARAAGCSGVTRMVVTGNAKIDPKIARDGLNQISLETRRSLPPVLKKLRGEGYQLVGLEQTTDSKSLCEFSFARRTALVIGNERTGLTEDLLALLDHVVEIPVFGLPYSFNVATATAIAMYEYCRQFPSG